MTDPTAFADGENWTGGFYELAMELGPTDDDRLGRALTALWAAAGVEGCYGSQWHEPEAQESVPLTVASLVEFGHLHGHVVLPSGTRIVCGAVAVREDDGPDWLDFYLPLGALGASDPRVGGYPFGEDAAASLAWRGPIDDWMAGIGTEVFREVDIRLAIIGFETSGSAYAKDLAGDPPPPRGVAYLIPTAGAVRYLRATT
jgi:hypothetical protein